MSSVSLREVAQHLDAMLDIDRVPDYANALNGVQVAHVGPVRRIAAAVDASVTTIDLAIESGANLLVVHHGLFWHGAQRISGPAYARLSRLIARDVAVYSAHIPLDAHPVHGNSRLLALELGLMPDGGFARYQTVDCGVTGACQVRTRDLVSNVRTFAAKHGTTLVTTRIPPDRMTQRWAICSGSGASMQTFAEALERGVDTLIVGEGSHWTAIEAEERGLAVLYAGHYATETLGVQSLAAEVQAVFGLPWSFIAAPTSL